jgi:hypothetical protein
MRSLLRNGGSSSRPTRGDREKRVPEAVQKVVMSKHGDDALVHITGAPLVMHAVIPERNVELCLK